MWKRQLRAVKGVDADVDKELTRVTNYLKRKGRDLTSTAHEVLVSKMHGSFDTRP